MIRRYAPALLCLAVLLVAARLSTASSHFRVNEDATRLSPRDEAARGAEGYGMLLAEVGLPPGVEVDRVSLERARSTAVSALYRYDVLPVRLVLYLWPPGAESARLDFTFRPRYGLRAMTAPSQIYDYYNPEARAVVGPVRFVVR